MSGLWGKQAGSSWTGLQVVGGWQPSEEAERLGDSKLRVFMRAGKDGRGSRSWVGVRTQKVGTAAHMEPLSCRLPSSKLPLLAGRLCVKWHFNYW